MGALRRSGELTRGHYLHVFGLLILTTAVNLGLSGVAGSISGGRTRASDVIIEILIGTIIRSFTALTTAILYFDLLARVSGRLVGRPRRTARRHLIERELRVCSAAMGLRIVVADDNLLVREGVLRLLGNASDIDVVASCPDYDSALEAVDRLEPDVVLTDIKMPPTSTDEGIRLATRLRETHPSTGVVVLSQFAEPGYVLALLEAGSDRRGYLLKERVSDRLVLVSAVRTVAAGGSTVDPKVVDVLVSASARDHRSPLAGLTPRERDVLSRDRAGQEQHARSPRRCF